MMTLRKHRNKPTDFTRQRKLGFKEILVSVLINLKHSLAIEIDNFIKKLDVDEDLVYTKQAYSKSRQKLLPSAFIELNDIVLEEVYNNNFKTFKGFRLIAVDGSTIELPNNTEMREIYGVFSKNADRPAGKICLTHDILNATTLNGKLFPHDGSEKAAAAELMPKVYPSSAEDIFIYDRGFRSVELILLHSKFKKNFVFRVQRGFLKEIDNFRDSNEDDKTIVIDITERRIKTCKMKHIPEPLQFKLRCVRVKLESEDEILITNLTPEQMTVDELSQIYNFRWGIETNYNYLKNILELENFTGDTSVSIQQDFYATIYISNLASVMVKDAQEEYENNNTNKFKKYEYKINMNIAMGYLKRDLLHVLLQENPEKAKRLYERFISKLSKHVIPIRKGRKFDRPTRRQPRFGRTNKGVL